MTDVYDRIKGSKTFPLLKNQRSQGCDPSRWYEKGLILNDVNNLIVPQYPP